MIRKVSVLSVPLISLLFVLNCGGPSPTSSSKPAVKDDPSFSADVQPILDANGCASSGCHDAATQQAGLNLASGSSYGSLVNVSSTEVPAEKRVEPGDTARSYIVSKLEGTASVGGQMPLGKPSLSANELQTIKNWIIKGAKNN